MPRKPSLSIVVPTFNEQENIEVLVGAIDNALRCIDCNYELWFIDDSTDQTPRMLERIAGTSSHVHFVHRETERGLATAVVEGFKRTNGEYLIVMDADLQHPPDVLSRMYEALLRGVDIVIPSRFVNGGSDGGLNPIRKLISWTARMTGRVFIKRLRNISDCTSGFFGLNRAVIEGTELDPVGWKILMEILVKGTYTRVHEMPYEFVARRAGQSKMNLQEQVRYLKHIVRLVRKSPEDRRFYLFCLVGAMGLIVNLAAMTVLLHYFHFATFKASVLASLLAMAHNFMWNDRVTWKDHAQPVIWRRALKFPLFVAISAFGVTITGVCASAAIHVHVSGVLGQFTGIVAATAWSYLANNKWTWKHKRKTTDIKVTQELT